MLCQFSFRPEDGRHRATCVHCGRTALVRSRRVYAACRAAADPLTPEQLAAIVESGAEPDGFRPVKLGDLAERCLRFVGLTKRRWRRWTRSETCGCSSRQARMNAWGDRAQRRIRDALLAVKRFYLSA
jgi:hypothetical protein